jgi:DNA-directed RNA polymerase specialized sigma24 family protein
MAPQPESEPEQSGASGARIQPESSVPEAWLVEAGQADLADSVDRMAGDVDLNMDLALEGYQGPLWDHFSNELAKYGYAVIASWIGRRMIFERCKSRGFGGLPAMDRPFTDDENAELTNETVAKALAHFRTDVLMKRKWDHRRGATLRTYFIGQCLIRFPNVYRRWLAGENRNRYLVTDDDGLIDSIGGSSKSPESQVVAGVTAADAMSTVKNPRVRKVMHLRAADWTHAEIADFLGITEKAVERMLANERGRLKKRGIA